MDTIRFSIEKPVTIMVGIIIVVLFGWISLQRMPYQLSPTVIEPTITVTTTWTGAWARFTVLSAACCPISRMPPASGAFR